MEHKVTPFEALQLAVQKAGSQSALARICDVSQTSVWKWLKSGKGLPGKYALKVEAATGVPRHWLAPEYYPHEIAPVSAEAAKAAPVCAPILTARALGRNGNRHPILDNERPAA